MEVKEVSKGFEKVFHNGELLAIVIRDKFDNAGLNFFTENEHSFQLAMHNVGKGKRYRAHFSLPFEILKNLNPNKIYLIKKGKAGVDFYDKSSNKVGYLTLDKGDMILFVSGGHGCDILEEGTSMIEIKQGPYRGAEIEKKFLE